MIISTIDPRKTLVLDVECPETKLTTSARTGGAKLYCRDCRAMVQNHRRALLSDDQTSVDIWGSPIDAT
jgi:hypothetical protein